MVNQVKKQDFYVYGAQTASLAAGAELTVNIQVEADSDFEWIKTSFFATVDAGGAVSEFDTALPLITVQIQDSGSGRNLLNIPTLARNIAGSGRLPFVLPISRFFRANSNIGITLKNIATTDTYLNLDFSLIGRKIWH